ncbi:glycosyltransferase family 2 protein [Flavobacterium foetidum]|uniref:glycosyltransferase family 2 protein n=1 Tax=Flavobacterium foetidum TaxID=2026681 RepID=UPI001074BD30|nr:glycosyltransferase family 2 protein [Flavobacterium foetidum]KAF2513539.1 glycosyltransferase family 2 protein [Flavobacterium foetidum]
MVSVIIPAYNSEKTIVRAIKSVILQTYKTWEVIIVDDGSKDRTVGVVEDFMTSLPMTYADKITLHKQINQGPSVARNKGIEISNGEYIAFLDSDDEWSVENKLELQMKYFTEDPSIALCGAGHDKKRINSNLDFKIISFNQLLLKNYFATPAVILKKEIFNIFKFDISKKYSEDFKLWLQICYNYKCVYINSVLSNNQEGKRRYGVSGLSVDLFAMEKGELLTYYDLYKMNMIGGLKFVFICSFSLFKYFVRLIKTGIYKLIG